MIILLSFPVFYHIFPGEVLEKSGFLTKTYWKTITKLLQKLLQESVS